MNLTYVKFAIVFLFVALVGAFVLAGKIDATAGIAAITAGVGLLVVSLGLVNAGGKVADAIAKLSGKSDSKGFAPLKLLVGLAFAGLLFVMGLLLVGCGQPVFPTLQKIEQTVADDLAAGKSDAQIASDVCADLGGNATTDAVCATVDKIVEDTVTILLDSGVLAAKGNAEANAKAFKARHAPAPATAGAAK